MTSKIKCEKIVINIGQETLELTPEQIKELRDILNSMYPEPMSVPYPIYPYRWWEYTYTSDSNSCVISLNS